MKLVMTTAFYYHVAAANGPLPGSVAPALPAGVTSWVGTRLSDGSFFIKSPDLSTDPTLAITSLGDPRVPTLAALFTQSNIADVQGWYVA